MKAAEADLIEQISTIRLEGPPILGELAGLFARLVNADADISFAYDVGARSTDPLLSFLNLHGWTRRTPALFEELLAQQGRALSAWSGSAVEPRQRNRVVTLRQLEHWSGKSPEQYPVMKRMVFGENELSDQLRVLVSDGGALLAFVGVYRRDRRFDEGERRALARLVVPLAQRLRYEQLWEEGRFARTALVPLLESLSEPTLLVDDGASVRLANAAGRCWLQREGRAARQRLADAVGGRCDATISLARVEATGLPRYWLCTIRSEGAAADSWVAEAAREWGLTPRQRQVLGCLALGASNKTIAVQLGCSPGTVALHVAAILEKAQVESRTMLVARGARRA